MTQQRNIKIDDAVFERLSEAKGSTDTWSEFLSRMVNASEEGQVHFDRKTIQSFEQIDTDEIELRASAAGELSFTLSNELGEQLGGLSLAALGDGEPLVLKIESGTINDN
jgi:predicted CopG family antitoxin